MQPKSSPLPDNVVDCHVMIRELQEELAQLRREFHALKRQMYGTRRERFVAGEKDTNDSDEPGAASTATATPDMEATPPPSQKRRTSKGRQPRVIPDSVPRVRVEHRLDEDAIPESLRNNPRAKRF